jgi:hypothetical protein
MMGLRLCFNYDERLHPSHRCKKIFLIEGIYHKEDGDTESLKEELATADTGDGVPETSLNALTGVLTPQTMRVHGRFKGGQAVILVDTSSTQNFMSTAVARFGSTDEGG